MLKKSLVLCFFVLAIASSLSAAVFSRMPENHWAWDSVKMLMDRGIFDQNDLKGFAGNRNMTRYEFAITYSRLLAYVAEKMEDGSILASKDDLAALDKLSQEFSSELALLGMRNEGLEKDLETVKNEISVLKSDMEEINKDWVNQTEKVKLSGNWLVKSTWKNHKNDWATNAYSGVARRGNSNNHAMESQIRYRFDAKIDENISMALRFRMLWKSLDDIGTPYNRGATWGVNGIGNDPVADNRVDTAFLKIKKLFNEKDEMFFGKEWYWIGHGMLINAFVDSVRYTRNFNGNLKLTGQYIYDRHFGTYKDDAATDFRGVWNLTAEKKCKDKYFYLALFAQDEPDLANDLNRQNNVTANTFTPPALVGNLALIPLGNTVGGQQSSDQRRDVEFGSSGNIGKCDTWTYDLAFVYSDYEAKIVSTVAAPAKNIERQGWQGFGAVNWKPNKEFKARLQYAFGDDENAGGYALVNDARYVYSHETPYEDLDRGNRFFTRGLQNMSDLKFQVEYTPKNAPKHYFRVVGDWLRELKDISRNDLAHYRAGNINGVIPAGFEMRNSRYDTFNNIGVADPKATMLQFEYRYQLSKSTKIKVGYATFDLTGDAQKPTAANGNTRIKAGRGLNNDFDYQLLWTEIYSVF